MINNVPGGGEGGDVPAVGGGGGGGDVPAVGGGGGGGDVPAVGGGGGDVPAVGSGGGGGDVPAVGGGGGDDVPAVGGGGGGVPAVGGGGVVDVPVGGGGGDDVPEGGGGAGDGGAGGGLVAVAGAVAVELRKKDREIARLQGELKRLKPKKGNEVSTVCIYFSSALFAVCWFFQVGKCTKRPACRYSHGMRPLLFSLVFLERIIRAILFSMQNNQGRPLATKVTPSPATEVVPSPAPEVAPSPAPGEREVGGGEKLPGGTTTVSKNTNTVIVVMKLHVTGERGVGGATYYFYQH